MGGRRGANSPGKHYVGLLKTVGGFYNVRAIEVSITQGKEVTSTG